MRKHHIVLRLILIVIGTIITTFGLDLAIHAGFGGATLAVLFMGLSHQLSITIGQASWVVAAAMLLFCLIYDRNQVNIGTIIYQVLYGLFLDIFEPMLVYSDSRVINFLLMMLGIIIMAFGISLYSCANLGRGTYEGMTFALVEKNRWPIMYVRSSLDILLVVSGVLLGGRFGLCTISTILLSGLFIQRFTAFLKKTCHLEFPVLKPAFFSAKQGGSR